MQALVCILLVSLVRCCNSKETLDNNMVLRVVMAKMSDEYIIANPYPSTLNLSLGLPQVVGFKKFLKKMQSGLTRTLMTDAHKRAILKSEDEAKLTKKVWIYDARDSKVAGMLVKMGLFEPSCFRKAREVLIELRVEQRDYLVTIFSVESAGELIPLRFPVCSTPCTLYLFNLLYTRLVPDEWNYSCIFQIGDFSILTMCLVSLVIFVGYMRKHCLRQRRNDELRRVPEQNASMDAVIEIIDERYQ